MGLAQSLSANEGVNQMARTKGVPPPPAANASPTYTRDGSGSLGISSTCVTNGAAWEGRIVVRPPDAFCCIHALGCAARWTRTERVLSLTSEMRPPSRLTKRVHPSCGMT